MITARFQASKAGLRPSVVFFILTVPRRFLCLLICVRALVGSHVAFVLSSSYHLWCLGKALRRDCGIFYVPSVTFLTEPYKGVRTGITYSFSFENTPIQIYSKFPLQKLKIFRYKNSDIFHISAQNIDCGYSLEPPRQGGFNEYPQTMFLSRNKKNNVNPCEPQFYII